LIFNSHSEVFETVFDHLKDENVLWTSNQFELVNVTHEYTIWTSNGLDHYSIYRPVKYEFTMQEKQKLHVLIRKKMEQLFFQLVDSKEIDHPQKVSVVKKLLAGG